MITLTKEQRQAVKQLYDRSPDGAKCYKDFRARVQSICMDDAVMIGWCGMFVGIEKDGYTHT